MDRRLAIRYVLFVSAGTALLPYCVQKDNKASIPLSNISVDAKQEELLAQFAETILPKTTTPGAREVSAHLFVLTMVDDCFKKEDQQKFLNGLKQFSALSEKEFGKPFVQLTKKEKDQFVKRLDNKKDVSEDLTSFYSTTKRLTLQSFLSSEYYLTKVQNYKQVPGPVYRGCVAVKKAS